MGTTVRVLVIALIGGVASGVALAASRISTGYTEAASFMLFIFFAVVTVGLAVSLGVNSLPDRVRKPLPAGELRRRRRWLRGGEVTVCGSCRRPMNQLETIWVCGVCDLVAVD